MPTCFGLYLFRKSFKRVRHFNGFCDDDCEFIKNYINEYDSLVMPLAEKQAG